MPPCKVNSRILLYSRGFLKILFVTCAVVNVIKVIRSTMKVASFFVVNTLIPQSSIISFRCIRVVIMTNYES